MAVIGIGAGVAVAGSSAYSSYSSGQAQKEAANAAVPSQDLIARAAGTVPKAAMYRPVNLTQEQLAAINGNLSNLSASKSLSRQTNAAITSDALRRIAALVPGYRASMQRLGINANDLLNGRIPVDDVDQIIAKASGRASAIGTPGTSGPATARDLGLSSLSAQSAGAGMLKDMVSMADAVSPIARYNTPQTNFVSPADRIRAELEQHQLIQQSEQNRNNLEATGDPAARLQLGLQTSGITGYHGGDPTLGAVNAGIGSLGSTVLGTVSGGAGGSAGGGGIFSSLMGGGVGGGAKPAGYQSWAQGPQNGTYYVPQSSYYSGNPGASLQYFTA